MIRSILVLAAAGLAFPAAAQVRTYGKETSIAFAAGGGIRNFEQGPNGSNIVYLQDRTLRWYQVTLTGPCFPDHAQDTAIYRTGPDGRLDRFSHIASSRFPSQSCGVTSILRSDAPPNRPKVRTPTARELKRQPGG
jgi:hypothetical protein